MEELSLNTAETYEDLEEPLEGNEGPPWILTIGLSTTCAILVLVIIIFAFIVSPWCTKEGRRRHQHSIRSANFNYNYYPTTAIIQSNVPNGNNGTGFPMINNV